MENVAAITAFAALAQEHRLAVFRLLMRAGPAGLAAGEIAAQVALPASTLSHHLAHLERAGLLRARRHERRIYYAVDVEGTKRLIAFLSEECCAGHPELCGLAGGGAVGNDRRELSYSEAGNARKPGADDPRDA